MKIRIHRGCHEIGGTCIELQAEGKRLLLDLGRPLTAKRDEVVPLPKMSGLETSDPTLLGILLSHPHQDHWGLLPQVHPSVPVYVGAAAANILRAAAFFGPAGFDLQPHGHLQDRHTFTVGPFEITPFLNDHSAFDAYSLLIEAGGRQRIQVKRAGAFDKLPPGQQRIYAAELTARRRALVLLFRPTMLRELAATGCLTGATLVWSQWRGYLPDALDRGLQAALDDHGMTLVHHHSSGHASTHDIGRLVAALAAKVVVPIHTLGADSFAATLSALGVQATVEVKRDGAWWQV